MKSEMLSIKNKNRKKNNYIKFKIEIISIIKKYLMVHTVGIEASRKRGEQPCEEESKLLLPFLLGENEIFAE
jgi:hypothetical protein